MTEAFQRLVARLSKQLGDRLVLKGGFALEVRLARARTTLDIDVLVTGSSATVLDDLQAAGRLDLGDYLSFEISRNEDHGKIEGDGIVYEGQRFRVQAMLGGLKYGDLFGLDVAFGDVVTGPKETKQGSDFFAFIGAEQVPFEIYPRRRKAPCVHAASASTELARQRSPGHRPARSDRTVRRAVAPSCPRPHIRVPAKSSAARYVSRSAGSLDERLRQDGEARRPRVGRPRHAVDGGGRFIEPILLPSPVGDWNPEAWTWISPSER